MDNIIHHEVDFEQPVNIKSPIGDLLRNARERANLSLQDVAAHLRLTCQLVHDIENDDYSRAKRHLVFLRGYLRSYAKLVDLNPDEIIDSFNGMNIEDVPIVKPSWQTEEAQELERAERSNWVAFIVLSSLLLVGVLSWWYSQYFGFSNLAGYFSKSITTLESIAQVSGEPAAVAAGNATAPAAKQSTFRQDRVDASNTIAKHKIKEADKLPPTEIQTVSVAGGIVGDRASLAEASEAKVNEGPGIQHNGSENIGDLSRAEKNNETIKKISNVARSNTTTSQILNELPTKKHKPRAHRKFGEMSLIDQNHSDNFLNQISRIANSYANV